MATKLRCALIFVLFVLGSALCAYAQLRPEVTVKPKPRKPPAAKVTPKPAEKPAAKPEQPQKPPEPARGQIVVVTLPNAEVYLDDEFVGRASPQGRLVIGNPRSGGHRVRVSLAGKRDYEAKVTVVAGQTVEVAAALADLPGRVLVRSSPGAEVFVDGSSAGTTDTNGQLLVAEVPAGLRHLRITAAGKREHRQDVTVAAGQETTIEATLEDLAPTAGAVRENPKDGLKYVWIPPGTFQMGCSPGDSECDGDEKPAHRVTISKGFWIGQTEVTVGAYKRFARETGRAMPGEPVLVNNALNPSWGNERMPIVGVDWDDAVAYCRWAGGRLPTEAEWEYAARAGSTQARYGQIDDVAWYADNSGRSRIDSARIWREEEKKYLERVAANSNTMHEVGQKRPNAWGLYDMLGNVWEWVNDWYDEKYYQNTASQDPSGSTSGQYRVLRGGSWVDFPRYVRLSHRVRVNPAGGVTYCGVRCVREVDLP